MVISAVSAIIHRGLNVLMYQLKYNIVVLPIVLRLAVIRRLSAKISLDTLFYSEPSNAVYSCFTAQFNICGFIIDSTE